MTKGACVCEFIHEAGREGTLLLLEAVYNRLNGSRLSVGLWLSFELDDGALGGIRGNVRQARFQRCRDGSDRFGR